MRKCDVPQDKCLLEGWREICYAVNDTGRYAPVPSTGWDPAAPQPLPPAPNSTAP
jgi:hypothetical protein